MDHPKRPPEPKGEVAPENPISHIRPIPTNILNDNENYFIDDGELLKKPGIPKPSEKKE